MLSLCTRMKSLTKTKINEILSDGVWKWDFVGGK